MKSGISDFWPDWVLGEVIGEGVRGMVCRAWKKEDQSVQAAVKIIEDVWNTDRLRKEIRCLQQLKEEPSIVTVDDFAAVPREDGRMDVYIRMELLTPLQDYFAGRDPLEDEIARMGIQLCGALARCHGMGILHQDIKPGNILVDDRHPDRPLFKLTDFSESAFLNRTESSSRDSLPRVHGTVDYLAPEAEKGHPEKRSDLYALGLTLYRCLNHGKLPFLPDRKIVGEDDRRVANRIRLSGMALPAPANASPEMADVLLKACAFHPEDRYESAEAFAAALKAVLHPKRTGKASAAHRWIGTAAACLALALCFFLSRSGMRTAPADTHAGEPAAAPGMDAEAFQQALIRYDEAFAAMDAERLPDSISDFPLVMDAWRYAPRLQAESDGEAWTLRQEGGETIRWSLRAENEEGSILAGAYDPDRQAWVFNAEQRAATAKLVASASLGSVNIDYDYDPASLQLSRIAVWDQSADGSASLQFNIGLPGEPEYLCILRSPSGLQLQVYGPDGAPLPAETSFSRLESRAAEMYTVWKERFEPALRSGRFFFPALWKDVPFAVSPDEAPTVQVEETEGRAFIRVSEHVPANWHVLTGEGIPVVFTPCAWDPEKGAWTAGSSFDRIRLVRDDTPDSLSVLVDYARADQFLPSGPVLSLELQEKDEILAFNCYLIGTGQAGQGGVFAQVRNADAFYAFYDGQGHLDHYINDLTGCVYGPDHSLREGTEPEGTLNPVAIGLP